MDQDENETWHGGRPRPRPRPHCVRWGPSSPSPNGHIPQFSARICCGQTAEWIKMLLALGMEESLGSRDFLLDGDPAPLPKMGRRPPIFVPCLLWRNVWIGKDSTWHGGGPRSRIHCARWGPRSPKKGRTAPNFLRTEVGFHPGDNVLDGDPALPPKRVGSPQFSAHVYCV